jgi:hypothetical protein
VNLVAVADAARLYMALFDLGHHLLLTLVPPRTRQTVAIRHPQAGFLTSGPGNAPSNLLGPRDRISIVPSGRTALATVEELSEHGRSVKRWSGAGAFSRVGLWRHACYRAGSGSVALLFWPSVWRHLSWPRRRTTCSRRTVLCKLSPHLFGRTAMRAFLLACVVAIAAAAVCAAILNRVQEPVEQAFATTGVRL